MRINISNGAISHSRMATSNEHNLLIGMRIGEIANISVNGIMGEYRITGGGVRGIPMDPELNFGTRRRLVLVDRRRGIRRRRLYHSAVISPETTEINLVVL